MGTDLIITLKRRVNIMKEFEYVTKINGKFTKVPCMQDCINAMSIRY